MKYIFLGMPLVGKRLKKRVSGKLMLWRESMIDICCLEKQKRNVI